MKTHRTVTVTTKLTDATVAEQTLRQLCAATTHWRFLDEESTNYTEVAGRPSYLLAFMGDGALPPAALALTQREGIQQLTFDSPNIVPKESGQLTLAEYNGIAARFVADMQTPDAYKKSRIKISISSEFVGLDELIPGKRCRQLFNSYLEGYPLTRHPADIRRLDLFTVAVFRGGSRVSPDDIALFLVEDKNWTPLDANWVRERMRTGLEILAASREF